MRLAYRVGFAVIVLVSGVAAQTGGMSSTYRGDINRYGMSKPSYDTLQPISTLLQPRRAERLAYFGGGTPWSNATNSTLASTAVMGPFGGLSARTARLRSGALIHPSFLPIPGGVNSARTKYAFSTYGGFGPRPKTQETGDLGAALVRKSALVQAEAINAPIHRANLKNASVAGHRASFNQVPMVTPPSPLDSSEPPQTLDAKLARSVELSHKQALKQGWAWFREGAYRQAAREFESAARLNVNDSEARVGMIFCHVALGATRTSLALLAEINRREMNPFLLEINMAEKYGRREEAVRLAMNARSQATTARDNQPMIALSAFLLWYLGEPSAAISAASTLATESGSFARWSEKMQAAQTVRPLR